MLDFATNSPDETEDCPICHGVGFICRYCSRPDGECLCEEESDDLVPCPECSID